MSPDASNPRPTINPDADKEAPSAAARMLESITPEQQLAREEVESLLASGKVSEVVENMDDFIDRCGGTLFLTTFFDDKDPNTVDMRKSLIRGPMKAKFDPETLAPFFSVKGDSTDEVAKTGLIALQGPGARARMEANSKFTDGGPIARAHLARRPTADTGSSNQPLGPEYSIEDDPNRAYDL